MPHLPDSLGLTPDDATNLDTLRVLGAWRAIELLPATPDTAMAATVAARLWCSLLNASDLENPARYGHDADMVALAIIRLACGHYIELPALPRRPAAGSSRAISTAEAVLADLTLTYPSILPDALNLAHGALLLGASDPLFAAGADVLVARTFW